MSPLVTVAVPTYNRPEQVREAVASALGQTFSDLEVVVGDNGSSEELRRWCESVAETDPRLRYQSYGRNVGMAGNWNALADGARGMYFVLLADDDRLLPGFVASTVASARRHNAVVAFSNHFLIDAAGRQLRDESRALTRQYGRDTLEAGRVDAERCVWQGSVPITASLIATKALQRLRFKEDLNTPEIEFFARLAHEGAPFAFVPEFLTEYRVHSGSATASGLHLDRLAERLVGIPVHPGAEPFKRHYLAKLLVTAVNICLERGDREGARRFLATKYYPKPAWRHAHGLVQSVCTRLPRPFDRSVFKLSRSVYRLAGGIRA